MTQDNTDTRNTADVTVVTPFTVQNVNIKGNSELDPIKAFERYWTKVLFPPSSPIDIALDAAIWILSAGVITGLGQVIHLLLLPLAGFIFGLGFAVWNFDRLRLSGIYRLFIILIGIFLGLYL